jgi:hypothetical protein
MKGEARMGINGFEWFLLLIVFVPVIAVFWLIIRAALSFFRTVKRAVDSLERMEKLLEKVGKRLDEPQP